MSSHPFNRGYFEDGDTGYLMYTDFPVHHNTVDLILKRKPESVLDVGGARGYIVKHLEQKGVRAVCIDISEHCWHTRATDSFVLHDMTKAPWPFKDNEFDLCVSISTLEHIPEDKVDVVLKEMERVSKRGLHGIGFIPQSERLVNISGQLHVMLIDEDTDKTHCTIKPREWWVERFKSVVPDWPVEILDKEETENPHGELAPDKILPPPVTAVGKLFVIPPIPKPDGLVKLNIGSFKDMFYYGWENLDTIDMSSFVLFTGHRFKQVDVTKGLPYDNNSVDLIIASHLLEHLSYEQGFSFLRECRRVLKPNGIIRLATPDTTLLTQKYLKGEIREYQHIAKDVEQVPDYMDSLVFFHMLMAGHRALYDAKSLRYQLLRAGFTDIRQMPFNRSQSEVIEKQTFDLHPTVSLYMEAHGRMRDSWVLAQCRCGERILDIGASNGWVFRDCGRDLNVTHVDIDRYDFPNFIRMDAHDLKFPDKSFDVAVLAELLEHVRDPVQVLKEARRVARKLVITTPNEAEWLPKFKPPQPKTIAERRQQALASAPGLLEFYEKDNLDHCFHQRKYDEAMLREHLRQAGIENYKLEILSYLGWSFFTVVAEGMV